MTSGPISDQTPVAFADKLPAQADVVIIGGGVIGVFSALYLNRAGLSVVLCEKGRIAGEQSSRNWGWIRQLGRDTSEIPIMREAHDLWQQADAETGQSIGFRQTGVSYLASGAREYQRLQDWLQVATEHGLKVQILSKTDIAAQIDQGGGTGAHNWIGAVYCPSDARAEPEFAVPAIAGLAQREGVILRENCAVRLLETSAGEVSGVNTENGLIATRRVVLAGGAWSSMFARRHGVKLPQLSVRSTVARTAPLPNVFDGNTCDEELAFRRRADGGYSLALPDANDHFIGPDSFRNFRHYLPLLRSSYAQTKLRLPPPAGYPNSWGLPNDWSGDTPGPFEQIRILNPQANPRYVEQMRDLFARRFPELGRPEITSAWAGMIDVLPDKVPVVDHAASLPGLVIATGMCGHGFGIGPGFGKIVSDLVQGHTPGHDISAFRLARFSDGSKLAIQPNI